MVRIRAALAPLLLLLVLGGRVLGDDWDPSHTYVTLAMVSEWQDGRIEKLPKPGNVERRLTGALVRDGVPRDHLVSLKQEAVTKDALRQALVDQARSAPRGSTLIFYFSGHGWRDGHGTVSLVTNEADQDHLTQTGLTLNEVEQIYEQYAPGKKVLLLGDFCYSGALERVVKKLGAKGIDAAAIASSPAHNESTENWTFTNTLIDALNGGATVSKDGVVTLASLEHAARDALHFVENQSMEFTTTKGFAPDFVIRKADPAKALRHVDGPFQLQDWVDAKARDGEYHRARVVDEKNGRYQVRFVFVDDPLVGKEQWLPVSRLREPYVRRVAVGDKIRAHDTEAGGWWSAVVKDVREGFAFVTYDELPRTYDEWVPTNGGKLRGGRSAAPAAAVDSTEVAPLTRTAGLSETLDEAIDDSTGVHAAERR
jgi:hypothetical protein